MLEKDVASYAASAFPRWFNGFKPKATSSSSYNAAWSLWYTPCRLCHEPVLNDKNWQQAHWQHHVLVGDIVVDPKLKPGERRIADA